MLFSLLVLPQFIFFLLFTPSYKSKSRLGFNDGHSWSLGQTSIAARGAFVSPNLYPLSAPSPTYCPAQFVTTTPPSCLDKNSPQTPCVALPPIPHVAPCRSVTPPNTTSSLLCTLFVQGRSNPSLCRLNLHTKEQCKDHQLCGYNSRVPSKTTHTRTTQIRVYLGLILLLQVQPFSIQ